MVVISGLRTHSTFDEDKGELAVTECNNNNIFILYSAKSIYSSKRFTIKMYKIATVKLIRNVKFIINIQVKNYATCS